jgi:hypothetical protein
VFDADHEPYIPLSSEAVKAFHNISKLKVFGCCCICGKEIELYWNDFLILEGPFRTTEFEFSELYMMNLPMLNKMVCLNCWNEPLVLKQASLW